MRAVSCPSGHSFVISAQSLVGQVREETRPLFTAIARGDLLRAIRLNVVNNYTTFSRRRCRTHLSFVIDSGGRDRFAFPHGQIHYTYIICILIINYIIFMNVKLKGKPIPPMGVQQGVGC